MADAGCGVAQAALSQRRARCGACSRRAAPASSSSKLRIVANAACSLVGSSSEPATQERVRRRSKTVQRRTVSHAASPRPRRAVAARRRGAKAPRHALSTHSSRIDAMGRKQAALATPALCARSGWRPRGPAPRKPRCAQGTHTHCSRSCAQSPESERRCAGQRRRFFFAGTMICHSLSRS